MPRIIIKQPAEALKYELTFASILTGYSIATIDALAATPRGLVAEVEALSVTQVATQGVNLFIRLAGGTDGETYNIHALATDSNAESHEADVEVLVEDFTWSVPDAPAGAHSYIAPLAYVTRYGLEEAIRLTDENQTGRIDKGVLFAALADAAAEIDGYLAKRYAVPLIVPVPLLESIAAAITRARLHTGDKPEAVAENLKAARAQLRDISRGEIVLPNAEVTGTSSGAPVYETTRGPFSGRKMRHF